MLDPEKYFEDLFDSSRITTLRLYNCCANTLNILTAANTDGGFTNLINDLQHVTGQLGAELGEVATAIGVQKGSTLTNDQVMAAFKLTMSTKEGVIPDAFGGKNTPGYLLFYPQGSRCRCASCRHRSLCCPVPSYIPRFGKPLTGACYLPVFAELF